MLLFLLFSVPSLWFHTVFFPFFQSHHSVFIMIFLFLSTASLRFHNDLSVFSVTLLLFHDGFSEFFQPHYYDFMMIFLFFSITLLWFHDIFFCPFNRSITLFLCFFQSHQSAFMMIFLFFQPHHSVLMPVFPLFSTVSLSFHDDFPALFRSHRFDFMIIFLLCHIRFSLIPWQFFCSAPFISLWTGYDFLFFSGTFLSF